MFRGLRAHLTTHCALVAERAEGVAFFRAIKDLYNLASIDYACINILINGRSKYYVHCVYSDTHVSEFTSNKAVCFQSNSESRTTLEIGNGPNPPQASFVLTRRQGEVAFFGVVAAADPKEWIDQGGTIWRECRLLGNYFHGHILRIHGYDSSQAILVSARELDCLKWTAAGKTALEASIILGITERTVRFHLNAAREKLGCVTTTQAVAKAVAHQLIEI